MTTINPTQPLYTLRNNAAPRSCQQLGVCLHPQRSCTGECAQRAALQRLAPGVVAGPYRRRRRDRVGSTRGRLVGVLLGCVVLCISVLVWGVYGLSN